MNLPLLLSLLCLSLVHCHISSKTGGNNQLVKTVIIEKEFGSSSSSSGSSEEVRRGPPRRHRSRRGPSTRPRLQDPPPATGCPQDWMIFDRPQGRWCVEVFSGSTTRDQAETLCRAQGATLSGLQDGSEIYSVTSRALRVLSPKTSGSLWIGARRTPACLTSSLTASCTPSNSFMWTDAATTGTQGFLWNPNQPDNSYQKTQHCAVLWASSQPAGVGYNSNQLDDVSCTSPGGSEERLVRGYVCGKRAQF